MNHKTKRSHYFPAEWEPQDAVLVTWPHPHSDWKACMLGVESVYLHLCSAISHYQAVLVLCYDEEHLQTVHNKLVEDKNAKLKQIHLFICKSNDTWVRDYAAVTIIKDNKPHLLDFRFNGWGGKYRAELDNTISTRLNQLGLFSTTLSQPPLILEGGSIESDGQGTIMTTSRCLLNGNRNTQLNKAELEQQLKQHLFIDQILWLENGLILGDDTDGHIDNLVRFVNSHELLYLACDDPNDAHYEPLAAMKQELESFRTADGDPYRLHPITLPSAVFDENQRRLAASYLNFLIINHAVLVPIFNADEDQTILNRLQSLFINRTVIGINCRALLEQNGGLHCATMQFPRHTISQKQLELHHA